MGRKRKYTVEHLEKVFEILNDYHCFSNVKVDKNYAIKMADFKNRQSYYDTLSALNYEEVVTLVKVKTDEVVRKYKRKYNAEQLQEVIDNMNKGKMFKHLAIESAGFKHRRSYYDALASLGYKEVTTVRKFEFETLEGDMDGEISFL